MPCAAVGETGAGWRMGLVDLFDVSEYYWIKLYRGSIHWSTRLLSTTVEKSAAKENKRKRVIKFFCFFMNY